MANDINKVVLVARLTQNGELKYSSKGTAILSFSVASNEKYGETEHVSFFECSMFGKFAETMNQYLTKGKQIAITGKLVQERWQNNEGQNRSKIKIKVDELQLLGGDKSNNNQSNDFEDDNPPF